MHPHHPHCSLPELIRESNLPNLRMVCYMEEGDREMCSKVYSICPCQDQENRSNYFCPDLTKSTLSSDSKGGDCVEIIAESNGYSLIKQQSTN